MDRLILVRHGETEWNARKVLQGQADVPLSARGQAQAQALYPIVRRWQPSSAVCSDLGRAVQTAALLGWTHAQHDARLREAHLGEWTTREVAELKRDDGAHYQRWRDGKDSPPGGEDFSALKARVMTAIDSLSISPGAVLVVTHGGVIRAALSSLIGLHPDRIMPVDPASATVLQMSGAPRLVAYNVSAYDVGTETSD